jgi:hypothetical protein
MAEDPEFAERVMERQRPAAPPPRVVAGEKTGAAVRVPKVGVGLIFLVPALGPSSLLTVYIDMIWMLKMYVISQFKQMGRRAGDGSSYTYVPRPGRRPAALMQQENRHLADEVRS